jgi:hypothetical protein
LENVLHALLVGYTLVSLGALDSLWYCIEIGGGHLEIESGVVERLAHIARTVRGLYRVSREGHGGYAVELSQRDGVAPAHGAHRTHEHCEACIFACANWKPVTRLTKLRVSEQAKQFGDEIHTDGVGASRSVDSTWPTLLCHLHGRRYPVHPDLPPPAKSDTVNHYRQFEAWARTQNYCNAVNVLRSAPHI